MKVKFWGCRGSIAVPDEKMIKYGGNTTCIEVFDEQDELIIDAGTGIRRLGEDLINRGVYNINLFITHSHWDHIQGFPFFPLIYSDKTRITIYGCSDSYRRFEDIFAHQMSYEYFPISFMELKSDIRFVQTTNPIKIGNFTVHIIRNNHPVYTLGLRIEKGGSSFVFITDNELMNEQYTTKDEFISFCKGATYLIHDAQFTEEEYKTRKTWGHSTFEQVLELADKAKVKNVGFTHHDPTREDEELEKIELELSKKSYPFKPFIVREKQEINFD